MFPSRYSTRRRPAGRSKGDEAGLAPRYPARLPGLFHATLDPRLRGDDGGRRHRPFSGCSASLASRCGATPPRYPIQV